MSEFVILMQIYPKTFQIRADGYVPVIKLISNRALVVNIGNDTDIWTIPDANLWDDEDFWTTTAVARKFSSETV